MAEDELKEAEELEEKVKGWVLREYDILMKVHDYIEKALETKDKRVLKPRIKKILRKERKEERIERRQERVFKRLLEAINKLENSVKGRYPEFADKFEEIKEKAEAFDHDMVRLGAGGGELRDILEKAREGEDMEHSLEDLNKALDEVNQLIKDDKGLLTQIEHLKGLEKKYPRLVAAHPEKIKDLLKGKGIYGDYSQEKRRKIWNKWVKTAGRRKVIEDLDAPKADLRGFDLRGFEFKGKTNLKGADLRGVHLEGANFFGAHLVRAHLVGANLSRAYLGEANLKGANLERANLLRANLYGADLREANLKGAHLVRAHLVGAILSRANLREANLKGADLREANLFGAKNLSAGQLREANNWEKAKNIPEDILKELRAKS